MLLTITTKRVRMEGYSEIVARCSNGGRLPSTHRVHWDPDPKVSEVSQHTVAANQLLRAMQAAGAPAAQRLVGIMQAHMGVVDNGYVFLVPKEDRRG